jgi:GcrA cell cycle regulator
MSWTESRVQKLTKLWAEGKTAEQIAQVLGGASRNAVIAKIHRLGLRDADGFAGRPSKIRWTKDQEEQLISLRQNGETFLKIQQTLCREFPESSTLFSTQNCSRKYTEMIKAGRAKDIIVQSLSKATIGEIPFSDAKFNKKDHDRRERVQQLEEAARRDVKAKRLGVLDLTEKTCKWPIGDPADEDFFFCGLSAPGKGPYCDHHLEVAHRPSSEYVKRSWDGTDGVRR